MPCKHNIFVYKLWINQSEQLLHQEKIVRMISFVNMLDCQKYLLILCQDGASPRENLHCINETIFQRYLFSYKLTFCIFLYISISILSSLQIIIRKNKMYCSPFSMPFEQEYFKGYTSSQEKSINLIASALRNNFQDYCNRCLASGGNFWQAKAQKCLKSRQNPCNDIIEISDEQQEVEKQEKGKKSENICNIRVQLGNQGQQEDTERKQDYKTQDGFHYRGKIQSTYFSCNPENAIQEEPVRDDYQGQMFTHTDFLIACPPIGMKNSQILEKRAKLMARKVKNWNQVNIKGKKKREVAMLKR